MNLRETVKAIPKSRPVSLSVAMTRDRIIGNGDVMPWHIPEELAIFKKRTLGGIIIMGSRTLIGIGRHLPNRKNLILSRSPKDIKNRFVSKEVEVFSDLPSIFARAFELAGDIFVCGGARVYENTINTVDRMYISEIKHAYPGNIRFPEIDYSFWDLAETRDYTDFVIKIYNRKV